MARQEGKAIMDIWDKVLHQAPQHTDKFIAMLSAPDAEIRYANVTGVKNASIGTVTRLGENLHIKDPESSHWYYSESEKAQASFLSPI